MFKKYNYALYSKYFLYSGVGFLIIGFIFAIYYSLTNDITAATFGFGFFSGGVGLFSIGVAFHSLRISEESKKIAKDSDNKMTVIANYHFKEITDDFTGYYRICSVQLKEDSTSYHKRNNTFKWLIDARYAVRFKPWVDEDSQDGLVQYSLALLKDVPWSEEILTNQDVINIIGMCHHISHFDMREVRKEKMVKLLRTHVCKMKKGENLDSYVQRIIINLKSLNSANVFKKSNIK